MATIGVFLTISAGLFFYWLRCRFRFCYGLCEIAVAIVVISLTFFPPFTALAADDVSALGSLMSNGAGILGGIYIFVPRDGQRVS
jgi:hypothetical protein